MDHFKQVKKKNVKVHKGNKCLDIIQKSFSEKKKVQFFGKNINCWQVWNDSKVFYINVHVCHFSDLFKEQQYLTIIIKNGIIYSPYFCFDLAIKRKHKQDSTSGQQDLASLQKELWLLALLSIPRAWRSTWPIDLLLSLYTLNGIITSVTAPPSSPHLLMRQCLPVHK